jgi:hypothetical protein
MTDATYTRLLVLFNAASDEFWSLPESLRTAFFNRLYAE